MSKTLEELAAEEEAAWEAYVDSVSRRSALRQAVAEEEAAWEAYVDSMSRPILPTADYDPEQAAARKAWAAANDALDAALEECMR